MSCTRPKRLPLTMGGATLYGLLGSVCVADFVPRKGNCSEPPTAMVPGTEPFPVRSITCAHRTRAARQAFPFW